MPFDIAGNFTRNYNFQQDRDNGVKILAARVDGEFDNFATGMNAVFFRDGRVPMQADLRMNTNRISGIADGTVGSPALKFQSDQSTGPYLAGLNQYAIAVNGVQRAVFNTAGMVITGDLNVSTSLSVGGNPVLTQASAATSYMPKTGGTFTGDVQIVKPVVAGGVGSMLGLQNASDTLNTETGLYFSPNSSAAGARSAQIVGKNRDASGNGTDLVFRTNVNGSGPTEYLRLAGDGVLMHKGTTTYLSNSKILVHHDGANGFFRTEAGQGAMQLGANGFQLLTLRANGDVALPINGQKLQLTDASGTNPYFTVQGDNNAAFYSTDAAGGARAVWGVTARNSTSPLISYVPVEVNGNATFKGDVTVYRPGDPTTGIVFFGNSSTKYIYLGSTGFQLAGAGMLAQGQVAGVSANTGVAGLRSYGKPDGTGALLDFTNNAGSVQYLYLRADATGKLYTSGSFEAQGNITSLSDRRLKSDIRPLDGALAMVSALQPVRFNMNGKADVGFVAQDVERILPELVLTGENGYKSLDYGRMSAVLAGAIQNLHARLAAAGL